MYFVVRGLVSVSVRREEFDTDTGGGVRSRTNTGDVVLDLLSDGSQFGEVALIAKNFKRSASITAVAFCEMDMLLKPDFDELVSMRQGLFALFQRTLTASL